MAEAASTGPASSGPSPNRAPAEVQALARARSQARAAKDWQEADRLRAEIESAGWKVIDRGVRFELSRAHPPDVSDGDRTRYGHSGAVPSRLGEPPRGVATVVLVATDWPDDLARAIDAILGTAPTGTSIVVAADDPSAEQASALEQRSAGSGGDPIGEAEAIRDAKADADLDMATAARADEDASPGSDQGPPLEVVWTSGRLGQAAALNCAIRRASAGIVVILDSSVEATGDVLMPLVRALDDKAVAVAGAVGLTTGDLRHFDEAPPGDVDAVEASCMAFRRAEYGERGPLDEHFRHDRNLDVWWSLVLRDEGPDAAPRRAVALDLPLRRHPRRDRHGVSEGERERLSRRNLYRIIDRFGKRQDLASDAPRPAAEGQNA